MKTMSNGRTATGDRRDNWYDRLTRGAPLAVIVGTVLVVGLLIAYQLLPVLKLIAVAMLIALVLRTIAIGLERIGAPYWAVPIILLGGLGAFAATALIGISGALLNIYISDFGRYDQIYVQLGAVIVMMLWLYLTGFMVFFGVEINAVLARLAEERKGVEIVQPEEPEKDSERDRARSSQDS